MENLFIFDLDGTLIDSQQDLVESVNAVRRYLGMEELPAQQIASYVGNGAPVLIRRSLGPDAPDSMVEEGLAYFLEYYREHMLDHTRPYPGVEEGLDRVAETGSPMAVLTNKPVRFSQEIIRGLGWADRFFQVYGGNSFDQKKPHPLGIEKLIEESGMHQSNTVMVGDSAVDVQTARNAGVLACGVSYGFQPETFDASPPDLILDTLATLPEEIAAWRRGRPRNG